MNNRNGRGPLVATGAAVAIALAAGQACGQSWLAPVSGVWSDGRAWSGGVAPRVPGDIATIGVTGAPYDVTLDISVTLSGFNLTSADATLVGSGGSTMTVVETVFADASLVGITGFTSTGSLIFAGDVCDDLTDTPLDHTGSVVEWSGLGDILLGDNAIFTHGAASVFNIDNNSRLFWDSVGTRSQLINNGKISKNSSGTTTFENVLFTNNGDVCVLDGQLELINVGLGGPTLQTGHWEVAGDADLNVAGAQYDTIGGQASVLLDGTGSTFGAIDTITEIAAGGSFQVRNGRNFATRSDLTVGGSLTVGQPQLQQSTFTVNGDLGNNGNVHLGSGILFVSGEHIIGSNGSFTGTGLQFGALTNNGLISPGEDTDGPNGPGQLTVSSGIFEQGMDGRMLIEIAGRQPGLEYDVFQTDVALFDPSGQQLAGILELRLIDGFVPEVGDTFDVFRFQERVGQFAEIEGLVQRGITMRASFTGDVLRVEVVAIPAPGALGLLAVAGCAGAQRRRR